MNNQNDQILLYNIAVLQDAVKKLQENINYNEKPYDELKAIVESVEIIKLSFNTLDKLQNMAKNAQQQQQEKVSEIDM